MEKNWVITQSLNTYQLQDISTETAIFVATKYEKKQIWHLIKFV